MAAIAIGGSGIIAGLLLAAKPGVLDPSNFKSTPQFSMWVGMSCITTSVYFLLLASLWKQLGGLRRPYASRIWGKMIISIAMLLVLYAVPFISRTLLKGEVEVNCMDQVFPGSTGSPGRPDPCS